MNNLTLHALIILFWMPLTAPITRAGASVFATGELTIKIFRNDTQEGDALSRKFSILVNQDKWNMSISSPEQPDALAVHSYEASFDGMSLYEMYKHTSDPVVAEDNAPKANYYSMHATIGLASEPSYFYGCGNSALWLAFYIRTVRNQAGTFPVFWDDELLRKHRVSMRAHISPDFSTIDWYNDGKLRWEVGNRLHSKSMDAPYKHGFLNASFKAVYQQIDNQQIPKEFTLTKYVINYPFPQKNDVSRSMIIIGRIDNARATNAEPGALLFTKTATLVSDHRGVRAVGSPVLRYHIDTPGVPISPITNSLLLSEFQKDPSEWAKLHHLKVTLDPESTSQGRTVLRSIIFTLVLAATIFVVHAVLRKNAVKVTQN